MSRIYKCDRCGKVFERPNNIDARGSLIIYYNGVSQILCLGCRSKLRDWFNNKEAPEIACGDD